MRNVVSTESSPPTQGLKKQRLGKGLFARLQCSNKCNSSTLCDTLVSMLLSLSHVSHCNKCVVALLSHRNGIVAQRGKSLGKMRELDDTKVGPRS